MFGRSFGTYWSIASFGIIIMVLSAVGRWVLSFSGMPYFPRGNVIFSIVLATTYISLCYGALTPRLFNLTFKQAVIPVVLIVLVGQSIIVLSTVVTYLLGIDSYFNHPEALNVTEKVAFGEAVVIRLQAIVPNIFTGTVGCALGQLFGKVLPKKID